MDLIPPSDQPLPLPPDADGLVPYEAPGVRPGQQSRGEGFSWRASASGGLPMLVTPAAPFTMPSLDHLDGLVERTASRALSVEGLREITTHRWTVAYHAFRRYLVSLPHAHEFFAGDVRTQRRMLEDWITWMRATGLSRNSIATYWRSVGALLGRLGRDSGMLNPLLLVPAPKENLGHPSFLTRERAEGLLRYLANRQGQPPLQRSRDLCLVGLMTLAGLRRQETLNLLVSDVDVTAGTLRIRQGKGRYGGRDRTAYMTVQLQRLAANYLSWRGRHGRTHPEFLTSVEGDRAMGLTALRRVFFRASRDLGVRITPHQLRHSYATFLRQAGISDRVAMELLGHRSFAMLQRYSHVLDEEPAREATRLRLHIDF